MHDDGLLNVKAAMMLGSYAGVATLYPGRTDMLMASASSSPLPGWTCVRAHGSQQSTSACRKQLASPPHSSSSRSC